MKPRDPSRQSASVRRPQDTPWWDVPIDDWTRDEELLEACRSSWAEGEDLIEAILRAETDETAPVPGSRG